MKRQQKAAPKHEEPGLFASTHWSLVLRAKDESVSALNLLYATYRTPLLVWLRAKGEKPEDAEDLVQGFLQHLIERRALQSVAQEKGRFRTFLLCAFRNYLTDLHRYRVAAKRGSGQVIASLDETDDQDQPLHVPVNPGDAPDLAYDRAWAESLLAASFRRLDQECTQRGHGLLCAALEPVLLAEPEALAYGQIANKLGMSQSAVKMAALRIRQRLKGIIREEVLETIADPGELDQELAYLQGLFGKPGAGM